jgi:hypothetical protein
MHNGMHCLGQVWGHGEHGLATVELSIFFSFCAQVVIFPELPCLLIKKIPSDFKYNVQVKFPPVLVCEVIDQLCIK